MDLDTILYYAVLPCLLWSIVLFLWRILRKAKKNVKLGLACAILAPPLFVLYYNDLAPTGEESLRSALQFLSALPRGNPDFIASIWPALVLAVLYVLRMVEFWYLRMRSVGPEEHERRLLDHDRVATLFAYTTVAIILTAMVSSAFSLGWVGAVVLLAIFVLVYIGAIAILLGSVTLAFETVHLSAVWTRRKLVTLIRTITRGILWIAGRKDLNTATLKAWTDSVRRAADDQVQKEREEEEPTPGAVPPQGSGKARDSLTTSE